MLERARLTPALYEEAVAFDAARDAFHEWHVGRFRERPPLYTPPLPPGQKTPAARFLCICPRCGASRRIGTSGGRGGSIAQHDPLKLCRKCQVVLLPFVPKEHRRRGTATAAGYAAAWAAERERERADDAKRERAAARQRKSRAADPERARRVSRDTQRRQRAKKRAAAPPTTDRDPE